MKRSRMGYWHVASTCLIFLNPLWETRDSDSDSDSDSQLLLVLFSLIYMFFFFF